jgi:hypothetical protein
MKKLSTCLRWMQMIHAAVAVVWLSLAAMLCWPAVPRMRGCDCWLFTAALLIGAGIPCIVAWNDMQRRTTMVRHKILRTVLQIRRKDSFQQSTNDVVRQLFAHHSRRMSLALGFIAGIAMPGALVFRLDASPWTLLVVLSPIVGFVVQYPTQRRVCRWIFSQLSWLDAEQRKIEESGQLPAYLGERADGDRDEILEVRPAYYRAFGAAVAFAIAGAAAYCLIGAIAEGSWLEIGGMSLLGLVLLPPVYLLVIFAILGSSWRKGLPRAWQTGGNG